MKAGRIHSFGPPNEIVIDEIPGPSPDEGELVVRIDAAGVVHAIREKRQSYGRPQFTQRGIEELPPFQLGAPVVTCMAEIDVIRTGGLAVTTQRIYR